MSETDESITLIQSGGGEARAAVELAHGTVLAGRYEIQRVLGRGGMGVVLRAYDRVLAETIAIKVLHPEYARQRRWVDRLGREVKLARKIQHPNVCRVFDFAEADGHTFITMELAANGTLRDVIDAAPTRPIADRLADAKAVAAGLAAIHDAGIVHRDVTPQNVLRMADGRLAVSDFGLATEVSGSTTSIHGGTLAYMAPEVLRGAKGERASDIWSLGVVIHEVVFGTRADGKGKDELTNGAERPTAKRTLAEQEVLHVCRTCMKERPSARPASAREVERRLLDATNAAGRSSWFGRSARRRMVAGCTVLVLALVVGVAYRSAMPRRSDGNRSPRQAVVAGKMEDWSASSTVLAAGAGRILCVSVLPGARVARVIWESPRRAEDVEILTGRRWPSPLRGEVYKSSCPQLSPDGKDLIYDGFDGAGLAHVFLAKPDGASPEPVVRCNEPSMGSEPLWLGTRKEFVFDVDARYAGIFSLESRKTTIVPRGDDVDLAAGFMKAVSADGSRLAVVEVWPPDRSRLKVFALPEMTMTLERSLHTMTQQWRFENGSRELWMSVIPSEQVEYVFARISPLSAAVEAVAYFPKTSLFQRTSIPGLGTIFDARRFATTIWVTRAGEQPRPIVRGRDDHSPSLAKDGSLLVGTSVQGRHVVALYDPDGHGPTILTEGPDDGSPTFLPDGREWTFVRRSGEPGIYRCTLPATCRRISEETGAGPALSADGAWLAYIIPRPRGSWIRLLDLNTLDARDLIDADAHCPPVWADPDTLWVSRRVGDQTAWTKVNVRTGAVVDQKPPVAGTCLRGDANIEYPVKRKVWSEVTTESELRLRRN